MKVKSFKKASVLGQLR